jgi:hypothetical protein
MTQAELAALIATSIQAAFTTGPMHAALMDPDKALDERRKADRPPARPVSYIKCYSHPQHGGTGARFIAVVVPQRTTEKGRVVPDRVVDLAYYTMPEDWADRRPDGMPLIHPNTGQPFRLAQQWAYENFWLKDLRTVNGRPLLPAYRMTPEEATGWNPGPLPPAGTMAVGCAGDTELDT